MAFGSRIKKVAFATATGIPQTYVAPTGESVLYVPPQRDVEGTGFHMLLPPKTPAETIQPRMGFWSHTSGRKNISGPEGTPPSKMIGWSWTLQPVPQVITHIAPPPILVAPRAPTEPPPLIGPDQFTGPPPPEVQRYDALPDTPPPGPAVPPQEPMWQAMWRQVQEKFAAPGAPPRAPNFVPTRAFADAQPGAVAVAGFDMQKLLLPVGLLAGVFLLMRARR